MIRKNIIYIIETPNFVMSCVSCGRFKIQLPDGGRACGVCDKNVMEEWRRHQDAELDARVLENPDVKHASEKLKYYFKNLGLKSRQMMIQSARNYLQDNPEDNGDEVRQDCADKIRAVDDYYQAYVRVRAHVTFDDGTFAHFVDLPNGSYGRCFGCSECAVLGYRRAEE